MRDTVYVVRAGDFVKIGVTNNLRTRLSQIRSGRYRTPLGCDPASATILASIPGDVTTEALVHDVFRDLSVGHEWFRWHPRIGDWAKRRKSMSTLVRDLPTDPELWPAVVDRRKLPRPVTCSCGYVSKTEAGHSSHRARCERGPKT